MPLVPHLHETRVLPDVQLVDRLDRSVFVRGADPVDSQNADPGCHRRHDDRGPSTISLPGPGDPTPIALDGIDDQYRPEAQEHHAAEQPNAPASPAIHDANPDVPRISIGWKTIHADTSHIARGINAVHDHRRVTDPKPVAPRNRAA